MLSFLRRREAARLRLQPRDLLLRAHQLSRGLPHPKRINVRLLGPDRITHNGYDAGSQLYRVQKAYATSLQQNYATYTYSPNGKRTSIADADGNYATTAYDGFDRLSTWTFPSKTTAGQVNSADDEQYGYDAADNRTSMRKRDGRTFAFTSDARDRVITKTVPAGCAPIQAGPCPPASATRSVYYGYHIRGLQLYARFDSASGDGVTNAYDGFGRLTASTTSIAGLGGTVSSTYDADGNRTQVMHPDGAHFDSIFDTEDRLQYTNATPAGSQTPVRLLTYAYDALGRPTTINPASSFRHDAYDAVSRPSSLASTFAGGVGNVTDTFGYNAASQIVSDQPSNYAFVWQGAVAGSQAYAVNGLNQYTTAGPASFTYDADGDLITNGASTYGYDAENRLISASGAATASLVYDPLGRLWQTTGPSTGTTTFLHDGDQIAIEYNGSGTLLRRYMWGPGVDDPVVWDEGGALNCSGTHALSANHQGSIIATADCSGNQQAINTYDEYGVPGAANVGRFQYTGQAWIPELGMYYYKARIYAPTLGLFMQTDPVGYKDDLNLYAYVGDDPIDHTDPTGMTCTGSGATVKCQIDAVWTPNNRPLTKTEKNAVQNFNKVYTKAERSLLAHPDRSVTVKAPGAKAFQAKAGDVAHTLAVRTFVADLRPGDGCLQ